MPPEVTEFVILIGKTYMFQGLKFYIESERFFSEEKN